MTHQELYERLLEIIPSTGMAKVANPIKGAKGSSETVGVMCKITVPVSEKKKALDKVVDFLLNEGLPCWVDKVDMGSETFFVMFNDTIQ
jgi:hypothetical protein